MVDVFIVTNKEHAGRIGTPEVQIYRSSHIDILDRFPGYLRFNVLAQADYIWYVDKGRTHYIKCRGEQYQYSADEVLILKLKATPLEQR